MFDIHRLNKTNRNNVLGSFIIYLYKNKKAVITTTNLQFYNLKSNTMKNTSQR